MSVAQETAINTPVLWTRLPASLDGLPLQPAVTRFLIDEFRASLKAFDLATFDRLPLPRYLTTPDMVASILNFNADEYWAEMAADRYGEHQPPDLPSYRWSFDDRPGFRAYARSLRPFSAALLLVSVAAKFDPAGPWFEAVAKRSADFADWCRSDECSIWAGTYDVCDIVDNFVYFFDFCQPRLSAEQRRNFLDGVEIFSRKLRAVIDLFRPDKYPRDSHIFRMVGSYAALSIVLHSHGRSEGTRGLEYWRDEMAPAFPGFGGDDGGWSQGLAYWKWKLAAVINLAEPMRDLGFADLLAKPFMKNTGYFKWYVQPPYARGGAFGDHPNLPAEPLDLAMVRLLGVLLGNNELITYADDFEPPREQEISPGPNSVNVLAMLLLLKTWNVPANAARKGPTAPSRFFKDEGIVASHSAMGDAKRDVMVLVRSSQSGSFNHAHADQNGFIAEAYGEPIFIDSGYYPTYHHPHMKGYAIQTMAHNALLLNNQGQNIRSLHCRGTIEHFETDADHDYTIAECAAAYPSNPRLVRRHLWFDRSGLTPWLLIADHVILRQPGNVDFLLHSYEQPTWNAESRTADFSGWQRWGGRARARVQFLNPAKWYWDLTDRFPYPADGRESRQVKQWHAKATTVESVYEHWLLTGVVFGQVEHAAALFQPSPVVCSVETGGWRISHEKSAVFVDRSEDRIRNIQH